MHVCMCVPCVSHASMQVGVHTSIQSHLASYHILILIPYLDTRLRMCIQTFKLISGMYLRIEGGSLGILLTAFFLLLSEDPSFFGGMPSGEGGGGTFCLAFFLLLLLLLLSRLPAPTNTHRLCKTSYSKCQIITTAFHHAATGTSAHNQLPECT